MPRNQPVIAPYTAGTMPTSVICTARGCSDISGGSRRMGASLPERIAQGRRVARDCIVALLVEHVPVLPFLGRVRARRLALVPQRQLFFVLLLGLGHIVVHSEPFEGDRRAGLSAYD